MSKILLVEDDNNLREIFEMRLQAEGYQTVTASNGEDALVTAMKEKPDLIVADVMMPKLSGFEMLETLRAAPEMSNTKVIMMTALGQAEDQTRGEKLGVLKYLVKSQVTLEDFVRVIGDILPPGKTQQSSTNNNQESEKSMPEDTTPTNPTAPAGGVSGSAPANPIGQPTSGPDMGSTNQLSSDQEQAEVKNQIDGFVASSATPPADGDSSDVPATDTTPVVPPPAEAAGGDSPAGSGDQPAHMPPSSL